MNGCWTHIDRPDPCPSSKVKYPLRRFANGSQMQFIVVHMHHHRMEEIHSISLFLVVGHWVAFVEPNCQYLDLGI